MRCARSVRSVQAAKSPRLLVPQGKSGAEHADTPVMREEGTPDRPAQNRPPHRSRLSDLPETRELVEWFLHDLERRIDAIRSALDSKDAAQLRDLAHHLASSADGYGFDAIGRAAREFESDVRFIVLRGESAGSDEDSLDDGLDDEVSLASLTEKAEDLIMLCRRAIDAKDAA